MSPKFNEDKDFLLRMPLMQGFFPEQVEVILLMKMNHCCCSHFHASFISVLSK
jgi:hypothetical protein